MNREENAVPRNHGARSEHNDRREIASVERENLDLRRQLEDTKLELRNAVQSLLQAHARQQSPHHPGAELTAPDSPGAGNSGFGERVRLEGPTTMRLRIDLEQARAELDQLHALLQSVLNNGKLPAGGPSRDGATRRSGVPAWGNPWPSRAWKD
jgi:hypothetical protein